MHLNKKTIANIFQPPSQLLSTDVFSLVSTIFFKKQCIQFTCILLLCLLLSNVFQLVHFTQVKYFHVLCLALVDIGFWDPSRILFSNNGGTQPIFLQHPLKVFQDHPAPCEPLEVSSVVSMKKKNL